MKTTYELHLTNEVKKTIKDLIKKYPIDFDWDRDFWDFSKQNPSVVIFGAAQKILRREGRFGDIVAELQKGLRIDQDEAEKLAHDIKTEVLPHVVTIEDEEPEEEKIDLVDVVRERIYEHEEQKKAAQEGVGRGIKQVTIKDVDENARRIEKSYERIEEPEAPAAPPAPQQSSRRDPYKETVD